MNTERIEELIADRGARPYLSVDEWLGFVDLVVKQLGSDACYAFCLYPYTKIPAKGLFAGFPGKIMDSLGYLNILELVVIGEQQRQHLIDFLDRHDCPWEITTQYDPDTDAAEPIGLRVFGYSDSRGELETSTQ